MMADASTLLMAPVVLTIVLLLIYAFFAMGKFLSQYMVRKKNALAYTRTVSNEQKEWLAGYPVHNYFVENPGASEDELEVFILYLPYSAHTKYKQQHHTSYTLWKRGYYI